MGNAPPAHDLARCRAAHARALEEDLRSLTGQLAAMPEVLKVVLFGSAARGRRDLLTDIDLLVVMRSNAGFVERCGRLAERLRACCGLDLLVYTPDEMARLADRPFMRKALAEGMVLHEKRPGA